MTPGVGVSLVRLGDDVPHAASSRRSTAEGLLPVVAVYVTQGRLARLLGGGR